METPIEVLRIEHSAISKELNRFRACDSDTRCFYCREWSQYVYKKHFVWNAKTQEDVAEEEADRRFQAGRYEINIRSSGSTSTATPARQKERSPKLSKRFEKLLETRSEASSEATLMEDIISACALWQTLPSNLSALPAVFGPLEFNSYPDAIPLIDDPKEPSQLLDPLIIERQSLCLPAEGFHLLKNLTGEILMSHTQPTCGHTRPESQSFSDLELERIVYNEKHAQVMKIVSEDLVKALDHSWRHLSQFLDRLLELEKERNMLMGKRCKDSVDAFAEKQQQQTFQNYWAAESSAFKKNKTNVELVDQAFEAYFAKLTADTEAFHKEFALPRLDALQTLIQKLWDLVVPTIQQMAERMASHEQQDERHMENCKAVSASLRGLHPADDVDVAVKRIQLELKARIKEIKDDAASVVKALKSESKPTVASRLEKIAQKDFKKRIKRAENGYYTLRQYFKYEVTQKIFPEPLFCKFCLVCIEALMQEGEVMEAVTIEKEVKRFLETHKSLVRQRQMLLNEFHDGVQMGRRQLAGILGKLFLKEGMRIQGENLALQRQNSLLKSFESLNEPNQSSSSSKMSARKKKNKKKKKKAAAAAAAAAASAAASASNGGAAISANDSSRPPSSLSSPKPAESTLREYAEEEECISSNEAEATPPLQTKLELESDSIEGSIADTPSLGMDEQKDSDDKETKVSTVQDEEINGFVKTGESLAPSESQPLESKKHAHEPDTMAGIKESQAASNEDREKDSTLSAPQEETEPKAQLEKSSDGPSLEGTKQPVPGHKQVEMDKGLRQSMAPGPFARNESTWSCFSSEQTAWETLLQKSKEMKAEWSREEDPLLTRSFNTTSMPWMRPSDGFHAKLVPSPPGLAAFCQPRHTTNINNHPALHSSSSSSPIPQNLFNDLSREELLALVQHMYQENSQLSQKLQSTLYDMSIMSQRYTEMSMIVREREEQLAQLYERQRRLDFFERRTRLVKEPSKQPMAGFGNQDLFAGYREEMRSSSRSIWQKVRCSNCGELGHTSSECKDACRYCGGSDHLSENCRYGVKF